MIGTGVGLHGRKKEAKPSVSEIAEVKFWERVDYGGKFESRMFTHSRFPIQKSSF